MPDQKLEQHRLHVVAPAEFVPLRLTLQPGGQALDVNKSEVIVGRHSQADVRLPLPDVSRRHCRLIWSNGIWRVFDLQSLNGIYVNDRLVAEAILHPGDTLRIGAFTFSVAIAVDKQPSAAHTDAAAADPDVLRGLADSLPSQPAAQLPRRRAS
jgi:pSer/pThr/pTyr-binding forkhead associated (FHA) protein